MKAAAKSSRFRWSAVTGVTILVIGLAVGGWLFFSRKAHALTDKDTIVLADFTNTTGDPVFDGTLRQGLAIQLEQSPFLKIMDDQQVQQDLRLMSLPAGGRITNQIAHDICVRDGATATIDGSIESLGKNYVITLQSTTCGGGARRWLANRFKRPQRARAKRVGNRRHSHAGQAGGVAQLDPEADRPANKPPFDRLEALQNYTAGYSEMGQGHFWTLSRCLSAPLHSIRISRWLTSCCTPRPQQCWGRRAQPGKDTQKAFGLIDRVSEFERDLITATTTRTMASLTKRLTHIGWVPRTIPAFGDSITT